MQAPILVISPEEQTQHGEGADVNTDPHQCAKDASEEACDEQEQRLPGLHVLDAVEGPPLVPVEQQEGAGEGEPDRDEAQLLLRAGQGVVHHIETFEEENRVNE